LRGEADREQDSGERDTERLVDRIAQGRPTSAKDPLAAVLQAAAAPDHARVRAGEEAAMAAFRRAQAPASPTAKRPRRAIRATLAAALAALSLGGVAVAATHTGLPLPFVRHSPHPAAGTPSPAASPSTAPGAQPSGPAQADPDPRTSSPPEAHTSGNHAPDTHAPDNHPPRHGRPHPTPTHPQHADSAGTSPLPAARVAGFARHRCLLGSRCPGMRTRSE
jgi:hypothetical protein